MDDRISVESVTEWAWKTHAMPTPSACSARFWVSAETAISKTTKNREGKPEDPVRQETMIEWVRDIAKDLDDNYGSRRMKKALNLLGYPVSRDKARKLMREANVIEMRDDVRLAIGQIPLLT